MILEKRFVPVIVGPTASGKTGVAIALARQLDGEIVSADSRQVYKYLDIGTAKPSAAETGLVTHHFINIIEPDTSFNVGDYCEKARKTVDDIFQRQKVPIIAGGSGLYIKGLIEGVFKGSARDDKVRERLTESLAVKGLKPLYEQVRQIDPIAADRIHPNDEKRILRVLEVHEVSGRPITQMQKENTVPADFNPLYFGLNWPRELLYERINLRVDEMITAGLKNEVQQILDAGFDPALNSLNTVGYKEYIQFLKHEITEEQAIELIKRNSRRYAKRQLTWLRANPAITWFKCENEDDLTKIIPMISRTYQNELKHQD